MKRKTRPYDFIGFSTILLVISILFCYFGVFYVEPSKRSFYITTDIASPITVVIDAGHGGEDGGACTYGGLPEKDLNLSIALKLCDMLSFAGINVTMTRTDDRLLYDPDSYQKGHKKSMDLAARLKISRDAPGGILISIHMNAFPETQYYGLQVYYSKNSSESQRLAELIQSNTKQWLSPSNNRKIKPSGKNIYLLDRFEGTAILIECGFLSNDTERALLNTDAYRLELARAFFLSIMQYISEGGR